MRRKTLTQPWPWRRLSASLNASFQCEREYSLSDLLGHHLHGGDENRVFRAIPMGLIGLLLTPLAQAHDLQYITTEGQAVVVKLFYADNTPFSFEGYEIYAEGEKVPIQVGRTDSRGRIAFLPDKAATWRVRAISEDGHGLDFTLRTDTAAILVSTEKPIYERYSRVVVGVAVIFGLFGLLKLFIKRSHS